MTVGFVFAFAGGWSLMVRVLDGDERGKEDLEGGEWRGKRGMGVGMGRDGERREIQACWAGKRYQMNEN